MCIHHYIINSEGEGVCRNCKDKRKFPTYRELDEGFIKAIHRHYGQIDVRLDEIMKEVENAELVA